MARLTWDNTGERLYETGVKMGVLYPVQSTAKETTYEIEGEQKKYSSNYSKAYAWNGLTSVSESPEGAEPTDLYADDAKYITLRSAETFGATVEAYMYPDAFMECDGTAELSPGVTIGQQPRKPFGLSYRTTVGNDTEGDSYGYKLHLIYGATVTPSERSYQSINDSPEAITFSWEMKTTPVSIEGHKPTANITIDSTKLDADGKAALEALEAKLYDDKEGYLPLPDEIFAIFATTKAAMG